MEPGQLLFEPGDCDPAGNKAELGQEEVERSEDINRAPDGGSMAQDAHALDGNQETNSCSPVAGVRKPDEEGNLNADGDEEDGDGPFFPTLVYTLPSFEQEPATPEQVVHFLISNGYLLSALELLVEAEQSGDDQAIGKLLGPFFDNPSHFPPEELAKCDGDDVFKLMGQLADRDKLLADLQSKASLAEYELRIAQEDMKDLKSRAVQHESIPMPQSLGMDGNPANDSPGSKPLLDGLEETDPGDLLDSGIGREELNAAVLSYLSASGYRLTAMTLKDEAVGKISRHQPRDGHAALVSYFRAFREIDALRQQLGAAELRAREMEDALDAARKWELELRASYDRVDMESQCLRGDIAVLNEQLTAMQAQLESRDGGMEPVDDLSPGSSARKADVLDLSYVWRGGTIHAVEALRVVADTLPRVVPSILINAREEMLPIFLAVIQEHPDAPARRSLSKALFNLIKKPDRAQRKMIVQGCRDLAARIGSKRTMDELLPHCWEQMNDKYPERRILVAETCGHLSPHISVEIRQSLMLGMLGQLADDPKPAVRASVAENLSLLLRGLEGLDKYHQVEELLFQLCTDVSDEVQEASLSVLLPAVVEWVRPSGRICTMLIPGVLERMRSVLDTAPTVAVAGHSELDSSLRQLHVVGPIQQDQIRVLLQMWVTLLPELRSAAAATCPVWVAKKVPDDSLQHSFDVAVGRIGDGARGTGGGDMDSPATEAVHADGSKAADNAFDPEDITNPFCKNPFEAEAPSSPALDTSNPFKADDRVSNTSSDPFADESDDETPGAPPVFGASSSNPFGCFDGLNPFVDGASMREPVGGRPAVTTEINGTSRNPFSGTPPPSPALQPSPPPPLSSRNTEAPWNGQAGSASGGPTEAGSGTVDTRHSRTIDGKDESSANQACSELDETPDPQSFVQFEVWATDDLEDEEKWEVMEWLLQAGLPGLIAIFGMVHPSESVELLRHEFCECMRSTCKAFGEMFTTEVIVPLFAAAISAPYDGSPAAHVSKVTAEMVPMREAGQHIARLTLLPVMLGGVLPCTGPEALHEYFMLMLNETSGKDGAKSWALTHRSDLLAVLTFVAHIQDMQMEMLRMMHMLVASGAVASRQGAALLGVALACNLDTTAVERRLLPALTRLTEDRSRQVRLEVVNAVSEVSRRHCPEDPGLFAKVQMLLDNLIMEGGPQHEVQMAMLCCLAEGAPCSSPEQLEFMLQKVLWLLAYIAQRNTCGKPPTHLAETATVVFDCLRAVDNLDAQLRHHHNVQLHMVSALTCLRREAELLDSSRRETLFAMCRDHDATTPAMGTPGEAPMLQTFTEPKSNTPIIFSNSAARTRTASDYS